MATCIVLANILAAQLITCYGLSTRYHPHNKQYYTSAFPVHGYKTGHKYTNHLNNYRLNRDFYSHKQPKHHNQVIPIVGGGRVTPNDKAERKITFYENLKPNKINSSKPHSIKKTTFQNFVTPKLEPKKKYEVTTKPTREFVPTAHTPHQTDKDLSIALDDEDVEDGVAAGVYRVKGRRHREHLNPLVYVDSYGKAHRRPATDDVAEESVRDYGPGRVVVHHRPGYSHGQDYEYGQDHDHEYGLLHHPSNHYKKQIGRVRMQVFRGPTRKYGRKRYAPWGYYVVQPADNSPHYQHHP